MKLWFDDVRGVPVGWEVARTIEDAKNIIRIGDVVEMSLDHDIDDVGNGNDLIYWMLKNLPPLFWPHTIRIHSMNRDGADRMFNLLMDAAPRFVDIKIKQFYPKMIDELGAAK